MRKLTEEQRVLIRKFVKENTNPPKSYERAFSTFTHRRHHLNADSLPNDLMERIKSHNSTEVLHENINRYMDDLCLAATITP